MLRVENLRKSYGEVHAVKGISFTVEPGTITGLVGNNGAGKTTTLKMLTGLLEPSSGDVEVAGGNPLVPAVRANLGFLPEDSPLYEDQTPIAYLRFFGKLYGLENHEIAKRTTQLLTEMRLDEPFWDRPIGKLSKGSARKVAVARCLLHEPKVVLLDEPNSGLDPASQRELNDALIALRSRGAAVLLSAHDLPQVETLCDHILVMHQGEIATQGSMEELRQNHGQARYRLRTTRPFLGAHQDGSQYEAIIPTLDEAQSLSRAVEEEGGVVLLSEPVPPTLDEIVAHVVSQ